MQHTTKGTHLKGLHLHLQSTHNEQSLVLNAVALIFLYKTKLFPTVSYNAYSDCQITMQHSFWKKKMKNSFFTPCLDRLYNLWNNTVHGMNYWVHKAGRYRVTSILGRVYAAFLNCYQFDEMTYTHSCLLWLDLVWMFQVDRDTKSIYPN